MTPQIALVGRPNVGKSSLFNALTGARKAIVADKSGVTRDRRYGNAEPEALGGRAVRIVDTGGWMPESWRKTREDQELLKGVETQILKAFEESSVIVLVMDIREGVTALDHEIVNFVRKLGKPFLIAANKADLEGRTFQIADFYSLGAEDVIPVSAEHKLGFPELWQAIAPFLKGTERVAGPAVANGIKIAIVGRPNVGKSSLLNQLVGEERSVASAISGTTTDPVDVELEKNGQAFVVIDTAGIRRHAKRADDVENLSVMYAQRALEKADLAFLVLDAEDGVTTQDSRIANLVEESGCAAIIIANKWDKAPQNVHSAKDGVKKFRDMVEKEMPFLDFAPLVAISAERGNIYGAAPGADAIDAMEPWPVPETFSDLWDFAAEMVKAREQRIPPQEVAEAVDTAMAIGPQWVDTIGTLKKVHQVGNRPPQFLAFVKDANEIPEAFRRYLSRVMRERYGFRGNPIRWTFRHRH